MNTLTKNDYISIGETSLLIAPEWYKGLRWVDHNLPNLKFQLWMMGYKLENTRNFRTFLCRKHKSAEKKELKAAILGFLIVNNAEWAYALVRKYPFNTELVELKPYIEHAILANEELTLSYMRYCLDKKHLWAGSKAWVDWKSDKWEAFERQYYNQPLPAVIYSYSVLGHRWEEAEPYIMKNGFMAYRYCLNTLQHRWEEAEPYIKKDPHAAMLYALRVLKRRWPEAEPIIKRSSWNRSYEENIKRLEEKD